MKKQQRRTFVPPKPAKTTPSKTSLQRGRSLTQKQQKFVEGKLSGKSNRRAAQDAGYAASVSDHASKLIAKSPSVDAALKQWYRHVGITTELLARIMKAGLGAKDGRSINWGERRLHMVIAMKALGLYTERIQVSRTLEDILEGSYRKRP